MKKILRVLLAVLLIAVGAMAAMYSYTTMDMDVQAVDYADLGETQVVYGGTRGLLILLADDASLQRGVTEAKWLASAGLTVGVVNVDGLLATTAKQKPDCINHVTLLDVYAQFLQQKFEFSHFDRPVVLGVGGAASYLHLVLAQAPAGIFLAGVAQDASGDLLLPAEPCGAVATQLSWRSSTQPVNTAVLAVTGTPWVNFSTDPISSLSALLHIVRTQWSSRSAQDNALPLVEMPQADGGLGDYFVVMLSGDGGWANIDKDIAEDLGDHRVAVVGWNSLRYFWQPKSPEMMAADLATVIKRYQKRWGKQRVVLAGFSLGADVLPFMVSRLPDDIRRNVKGLVLLSPSQSADFQFRVSDWLGNGEGTPNALLPELARIQGISLLCIYGDDESDDTVCTQLTDSGQSHIVRLPGDHHFDGDYSEVTRLMLLQFPVVH